MLGAGVVVTWAVDEVVCSGSAVEEEDVGSGVAVLLDMAVDEVVCSGVAVLLDVAVDEVVCSDSAVEEEDVGSGVAVLLDMAVDEVVCSGSAVEEVVCSGVAVLLDVSSADVLDELVAPSAGPVMARQAISSSGRASFASLCRRVAESRRASALHLARAAASAGHDRAAKRPPALRRYRLSRLSLWPTRLIPMSGRA